MDESALHGWTSVSGTSAGKVSCTGVPLEQLTYTVVDLETTGLKPEGNGITEICCLRVAGGEVVDQFASLVNPGRPIPPFIQSMTGINDDLVRDAPSFGEIIPSLLDFLGDSVLVAHHAPFDLSFLNYGLYCHGHRSLPNPVVDTLRLARRLLPGLSRGNLDSVAGHLGISIQGRHRAAGDAEATARVLFHLLSLCRDRGIESDAQLLTFVAPLSKTRAPRRSPLTVQHAARLSVLAERCRTLPEAPGVYLMRSSKGQVLYVGKAVSLRRRLASYFNGSLPSKTRRLLRQVESIEHVQLGSELEALLEESRLIKHHQPPFNVYLRSYRDYPFIKVDESGRYSRLTITRQVDDDGAVYFGPFRSGRGTEAALEILSRCFRLFDDRCPSRSQGEVCLYRQMNRCLAPCLGSERRALHQQAVEEVCRLLKSKPDELVAELVRLRDAAAERLDFETAALYRDGIEALERALARRQLLVPAIAGLNVLAVCPSVHPDWAELFVFGHGRLVSRARLFAGDAGPDRDSAESLVRAIARQWPVVEDQAAVRIDAESLDQVNIISAWLEGQGAAVGTVVLEPGWSSSRFSGVVDQVMEAARIAAGPAESQQAVITASEDGL